MKAFFLHQRAVLYCMGVLIVAGVVAMLTVRPAQPAFWIGLVVLGFGILASIASIVFARKNSRRTFDDRATLSDEQICGYFADSGLPQPLVIVRRQLS